VAEMIEAGRLAHRATEECATELNLAPLGVPVRQPKTAQVPTATTEPARVRVSSQDRIAE